MIMVVQFRNQEMGEIEIRKGLKCASISKYGTNNGQLIREENRVNDRELEGKLEKVWREGYI